VRALLLLLVTGCTSNPYCLTCGPEAPSELGPADLSGVDLVVARDLSGPCVPSNNGVETCDAIDNDCNGIVDDIAAQILTSDPNNCGACGKVCNFNAKHEFGGCVMSACVSTGCMPGYRDTDGDPSNGCEHQCTPTLPPDEVCDGRDNDCDGDVDNGVVAPAGMCSNQGVCGAVTVPTVCAGMSGWRCDYASVPSVQLDPSGRLAVIETLCDGKDNNCNGVVDKDGFPTLDKTCTAGQGACQNTGSIVCTSASAAGCSVVPAPERAKDEECNDIDDNCDGQRDERVPAIVTMCAGNTRPCKGYSDVMVPIGGGVFLYAYEASRADATDLSTGGVTRRACSKADALPWAGLTLAQAEAACNAVKDSTGASMRLCTSAEWQRGCEGVAGAPAPGTSKWSITPTVAPAPPDVCNDQRGPGSPWPTGTNGGGGELCYAAWNGADRVYDLSGNLAEWTSTQVFAQSTLYYEVRGGSFTTPVGGTTCEFNFVIFPPTFVDSNLGFRCCADHAP
jgi:hypothetical protein